MRIRFRFYTGFFTSIAGIVLVCTGAASAQTKELQPDTTDKVDAVLVLDSSGSMRLTDPNRLRDEGAKLFVQFLKPGDRLGVVEFSDTARVVRPLSDYSQDQVEAISSSISGIGNSGGYTDILAGLKTAKELLAGNKREDANQVIVLLSDGKMDPDPNVGTKTSATGEIFSAVLPELKAQGIKIHTLSFSDEADKDLLSQIAAGSEGENLFTPTSDKIHESYANLFLVVKKPQIVPLTSKGFRIDPDIQEATFYINRENVAEISIESPSGKKINNQQSDESVKWFKGQKFDVITILKPEVGSWQVVGLPPNDSFATVLTNLKLVTDFPAKFNSADVVYLQAQLFESEKPIILPNMTGGIRYAFQITPTDKVSEPIIRDFLADDGANGDKRAQDGIFTAKVIIEDEGEYRLRVVAQGPTFERNQQLLFRVKPRLVSISVVTAEIQEAVSTDEHDGAAKNAEPTVVDLARVELSPEATEIKKITVEALAISRQNKKRYKLPLQQSRDNALRYEVKVSRLLQEGTYDLYAILSGETKKGKEVKVTSQVIEYKKTSLKKDNEEDHVEELQEQKVEIKKQSKIPYFLLITVLNGAAGYFLIALLKKSQPGAVVAAGAYVAPKHIISVVRALEDKMKITELDLNDPIFVDESIVLKIRPAADVAAGAGAVPPPAGDAGAEGAPPPTGDAAPAAEGGAEAAPETPAEEPKE